MPCDLCWIYGSGCPWREVEHERILGKVKTAKEFPAGNDSICSRLLVEEHRERR